MRNKIFLALTLIFIIITSITLYKVFDKEIATEVVTFKSNYQTLNEYGEKATIEIPLYFNEETTEYIYKENISNIYITDDNNKFDFEVDYIYKVGEVIINNKTYTNYNFVLESNIINSDIYLNDANLTIELNNNESITLPIGNYNQIYSSNFTSDEITITSLYNVSNTDNKNPNLDGIVIELENKTNNNVFLNDISFYSENICIYNDYIRVISEDINTSISYNEYFNALLSTNYECETLTNLPHIPPNSSIKLFLPIYNKENLYINKTPLKIEYSYDMSTSYLNIKNFTFFDTYEFNNDTYISRINI